MGEESELFKIHRQGLALAEEIRQVSGSWLTVLEDLLQNNGPNPAVDFASAVGKAITALGGLIGEARLLVKEIGHDLDALGGGDENGL